MRSAVPVVRFKWLAVAAVCLGVGTIGVGEVFAFPVDVSEAPVSDLILTVRSIHSAEKSIHMNIYEFTSPEIANALIERIRSGIPVSVLEEGQPVGGLSHASRAVRARIIQAMREAGPENHFFEMASPKGTPRRFHYDHAKYIVVDEKDLLIGSENYSPTGNPSAHTLGNRGWEVFIHEPDFARGFLDIFLEDSRLSFNDVKDLVEQPDVAALSFEESLLTLISDDPTAVEQNPKQKPVFIVQPPITLEASSVTRITSPDSSLSGLVEFLNEAHDSIDLELMSFDSHWFNQTDTSPLLTALLEAARRGVQVRVLLNDESVFNHSEPKGDTPGKGRPQPFRNTPRNGPTVELINQIAAAENLNMSARICDVKGMNVDYIHNKGALVDNDRTLVSSINWNSNAVTRNREAAVVLVSPAIHDHYAELFEKDWAVSE